MNQIVNKFLLAGDKFIPEMHLRQPRFTYSTCKPFTKNKQKIQKFMKTGDTNYIYKNELDKGCFQHEMAYGEYKDLEKRMVYKFFDKKSKGTGIKSIPNQQLANELHKPIIRKFKKIKVYFSFKDNIYGLELADI